MLLDLPYNDYIEYYAPDYHLNIQTSNMNNLVCVGCYFIFSNEIFIFII